MLGDKPKSLQRILEEVEQIEANCKTIDLDIANFEEFEDLYVIESNIDRITRSAELMRLLVRQAMDEMEDEV